MPTVLEIAGLRVVIYSNDHRPPHAHIIGGGHEAVFRLNCPEGPPELRENYGFSMKALGRIKSDLHGNLAALCRKWVEIHGDY